MIRIALLSLLAGGLAHSANLPSRATLQYNVHYGGLKVGEAVTQWQLGQHKFQLETELKPVLGPHLRYLSSGSADERGLHTIDYAEFRGSSKPHHFAKFDWQAGSVSFGKPAEPKTEKIQQDTQDLNALPYQLAGFGGKGPLTVAVMTGRKLRHDKFVLQTGSPMQLMGKTLQIKVWRAPEGEEATEVWFAPELANLPVKIIRRDERGEVSLQAKDVQYSID